MLEVFCVMVIVVSKFMFSFTFVMECELFGWKRICAGLLIFVYICISYGDQIIKRALCPIYQFNPATCLCLSQTRIWISSVICSGNFMFSDWSSEVVVDIGVIVDHQCLNYFLKIKRCPVMVDIKSTTTMQNTSLTNIKLRETEIITREAGGNLVSVF